MDDLLTPAEIEVMAEKAGITTRELLRRAGVNVSIFQRWKTGVNTPTMRTYCRIRDAALAAKELKSRANSPKRKTATPVPATAAE